MSDEATFTSDDICRFCGGKGQGLTLTSPQYQFAEVSVFHMLFHRIPIWKTVHVGLMYPSELWWIGIMFRVLFEYAGLSTKHLVWCSVIVVDDVDDDHNAQGIATYGRKREAITVFITKDSYENLLNETKNQEIQGYTVMLVDEIWHEMEHILGHDDSWVDDEDMDNIVKILAEELGEGAMEREQ